MEDVSAKKIERLFHKEGMNTFDFLDKIIREAMEGEIERIADVVVNEKPCLMLSSRDRNLLDKLKWVINGL